jgi:hypothetical protein
MATVLEIHDEKKLPELSDEEFEEVKQDLNEILAEYPDTELLEILVAEDGTAVEKWKAPDADTVREVIERLMGPGHCDRIMEVEPLDV